MDFEESWNSTVSAEEAKAEIELHACCWYDFIAEVGEKSSYKGSEVLGWLGY